jgi:N-acyl-D-amino-acid deacylase
MRNPFLCILLLYIILSACNQKTVYDKIIRQGLVFDNIHEPRLADIGINGDTIAFVGDLSQSKGRLEIDASHLAVCPGFIDMQSQSMITLIKDGRSMSAVKQGVTLEVFGEGSSEGPATDKMKKEEEKNEGDIKYKVEWSTLKEYLEWLAKKGVSTNIASYVGAATIRQNLIGDANRAPDSSELQKMLSLTEQAMHEGALGIGSALIYAPGFYAKTPELIALCKVASANGGTYISHIRSEGNRLLEGADELIRISKEANIPAIFYHLKAAGKNNWYKMDLLLKKIDSARQAGLAISACMYTYTAGATGFDAAMPPDIQEGGLDEWINRLKDPAIRKKVIAAMKTPTNEWENLYLGAGPDQIICTDFKQDSLKYLSGKRLSEIAKMRNKSPEETVIDLVIQDHSRVEVIYFLMSEENVRKQIQLPYMSFGSDASSMSPEGIFLRNSAHPRTYGNFANLLGKYVRDEKLISLKDAIYRMSALPASQLRIAKRGKLESGYYADVVIFDPSRVQSNATYEKPHQLASGIADVLVNGVLVLKDGNHTNAFPGRVVYGPGYRPSAN